MDMGQGRADPASFKVSSHCPSLVGAMVGTGRGDGYGEVLIGCLYLLASAVPTAPQIHHTPLPPQKAVSPEVPSRHS